MLPLPRGLVFLQIPNLGQGADFQTSVLLLKKIGVKGPWTHDAWVVDSIRAGGWEEGVALHISPHLECFYNPEARLYSHQWSQTLSGQDRNIRAFGSSSCNSCPGCMWGPPWGLGLTPATWEIYQVLQLLLSDSVSFQCGWSKMDSNL